MAFDSPLARSPVSHSCFGNAVAVWSSSPTLVKVTVVPTGTRMRAGEYSHSLLWWSASPTLTVVMPVAIGIDAMSTAGHLDDIQRGPAMVAGGGGGHNGPTCPVNEKAHTASP